MVSFIKFHAMRTPVESLRDFSVFNWMQPVHSWKDFRIWKMCGKLHQRSHVVLEDSESHYQWTKCVCSILLPHLSTQSYHYHYWYLQSRYVSASKVGVVPSVEIDFVDCRLLSFAEENLTFPSTMEEMRVCSILRLFKTWWFWKINLFSITMIVNLIQR